MFRGITPLGGSRRPDQAGLSEVARHLDWIAREAGEPPRAGGDVFAFGLRMNKAPRSRKGRRSISILLAVLRDFWLGLLAHVGPRPYNVVSFRRPS